MQAISRIFQARPEQNKGRVWAWVDARWTPPNTMSNYGRSAFDQVNRLAALRDGILDSADLAGGFEFGSERIPLIN
jgi:hypothetical protein